MSSSLLLSGSTVSSSFIAASKLSLLRNPNQSLSLSRNLLRSFKPIKCSSADSPYGGNVLTFPLTRVWDPYKRLGISPYASEEEIWASWFGALTVGWFCGSLVIPMIPTAFINPWTLELLTSLVAYVFLFLSCTFLK